MNKEIAWQRTDTPAIDPVLRLFLADQVRRPDNFNVSVCPRDEMFLLVLSELNQDHHCALIRYLAEGRRFRDCLLQLVQWHFGSFYSVGRFLDFAGGCGRLTRYLVQEIPAARIWVSDIYGYAVEFQERQFGVRGILSTPEPEDFPQAGPFDCIYVGSLFSHLPDATFSRWLKKLYSMLTPAGMLIFSVHDMRLMAEGARPSDPDYHFVPHSESRTLDARSYGTTYVSENYVRRQLAKIVAPTAAVHRIPRGLAGFQDLYIVLPQARPAFTELRYSNGCDGRITECGVSPSGRIHFAGRAMDANPGGRIEAVRVQVNGHPPQQCELAPYVPTASDRFRDKTAARWKWQCDLTADMAAPDDVLLIKAINSSGMDRVIEAEKLGRLIARFAAKD